ncbi:MAG: sugar phosphate isomerase/epimerase [Actinomycetota bacterium]
MTMAAPRRVLLSSAALFGRPLAQTMSLAADAGYGGIEVMVTRDPSSQDPRRIRQLASAYGLEVGALHAPCLLLTRRVWGTDPVGKIHRAMEVAEAAGAPLVVMHPPYRWQRAYRSWLEERLAGLEQRTGVLVAFENMFPVHVGRRPVAFHTNQDLDDLDRFDDLTLDTSHAAVAGHDLLEVRRRFGSRLRHVHLSDNAGKGWDSHLPPGEGVLALDDLLNDLTSAGYEGAVTLEVDLRRHAGNAGRLREVMVAMRERTESLLSPRG